MNPLHPSHMTAAERLTEVAKILATGLMRLRARKSSPLRFGVQVRKRCAGTTSMYIEGET
jgi:hypothetical protein